MTEQKARAAIGDAGLEVGTRRPRPTTTRQGEPRDQPGPRRRPVGRPGLDRRLHGLARHASDAGAVRHRSDPGQAATALQTAARSTAEFQRRRVRRAARAPSSARTRPPATRCRRAPPVTVSISQGPAEGARRGRAAAGRRRDRCSRDAGFTCRSAVHDVDSDRAAGHGHQQMPGRRAARSRRAPRSTIVVRRADDAADHADADRPTEPTLAADRRPRRPRPSAQPPARASASPRVSSPALAGAHRGA